MKDVSAYEYISLGWSMRYLQHLQGTVGSGFSPILDNTIETLKDLDFPHAQENLDTPQVAMHRSIAETHCEQGNWNEEGVDKSFSETFGRLIEGAFVTLKSESVQRTTRAVDRTLVSDKVRSLGKSLTDVHQRAILEDLMTCLECSAPRATIVMGWNLAYEHVRRWAYSDPQRLAKFNALLTTKTKGKTTTHDPIVDYEDFFAHSERYILDWLFEAKMISKEKHQTLVDALNKRNRFAHPSFAQATPMSAAGYVDDLVINVLASTEFV